MVDAGGTNSVIQISNEGPYMIFLVRNDSVDNGQMIPIDGTNGVPGIQAGDKVIAMGGTNFSAEKSLWGGTFTSVEYSETNMHFTVVDSGASSHDIAIVFVYIPQGDTLLGD